MPTRRAFNILVLYSELAGYTVACLNRFCDRYPRSRITVISWPVNAEAPFRFQFSEKVVHIARTQFTVDKLVKLTKELDPQIILCSGWRDKGYLKVTKAFPERSVLLMDNQWKGSMRQRIGALIYPWLYRKCFKYAWVPGLRQFEFASKLGFPDSNIRTGFYSGDVELFNRTATKKVEDKGKSFPHRFVFVGRYLDFKGINELWREFARFKKETQNDWQLWCFGVGDIKPPEQKDVTHFGFMQPAELSAKVGEGGVFVLPSKFEPWGVVVHEFAMAGFPLILSQEVGAGDTFLSVGQNGFKFDYRSEGSLCTIFKEIASRSDEELRQMGIHSVQLASKISPDTWCDTLEELCQLISER